MLLLDGHENACAVCLDIGAYKSTFYWEWTELYLSVLLLVPIYNLPIRMAAISLVYIGLISWPQNSAPKYSAKVIATGAHAAGLRGSFIKIGPLKYFGNLP